MEDPDELAAAHVQNVGKELHGEHWVGPLAADLNVNERTVRRIAAAARSRTGYPAARNLIEPLQRMLIERAIRSIMVADNMDRQRAAMGLPPAQCVKIPMEKVHELVRHPPHPDG